MFVWSILEHDMKNLVFGDCQQSCLHQVIVLLVCDLKRSRQMQASESSQEALPFLRAESVEPLKFKTCAAQQVCVKEIFQCEPASSWLE